MATLKTIRKRIVSVRNTQKITKAMKMVAAAKLRRAQTAGVSARPYTEGLRQIVETVAAKGDSVHPLLEATEKPAKASFLIFTSNRGLCGGFNSNLLRKIETHLQTLSGKYETVDIRVIGKKGRDFYRARRREPSEVLLDFADRFSFSDAEAQAKGMIDGFLAGTFDEIFIVYNQFRSALSQVVAIEKVLPFSVTSKETLSAAGGAKNLIDFIYEPGKKEILDLLIPKCIATQLFKAHLESVASELGARMTAMENATNNARDMMGLLTLQYNRVRQAAITRELMDIVNGAEAIK